MNRLLLKLYIINLTLLITHEIDSAFWHEWVMFHLPGGIQFFLLINFALILFFILGIEKVLKEGKHYRIYSYLLASAGILAFLLHTSFIIAGYKEFLLPVSILLLSLIFVFSIAQVIVQLRIK